jgi:putative phage-type endonuclease
MRVTYGRQQSDAWLRNRVGRITGSRIADVISVLTRTSGAKKAGDPSAKRDAYKLELIAERLTGRAKDHYVSMAMEHGTATEDDARLYYEGALRMMCEPVSFVLHPKYDFTGSSPDALVGEDGILEIKCPDTTTHLDYVLGGKVPDEYLPQIMWELACTGRKWADFVSYDPRIQDDKLRFFYRRVERDEALIAHYTEQVLKLNAEIEYFFAERNATPIAPYPVELITEDGEVIEQGDPEDISSAAYAYLDSAEMVP